MSVQIVPLLYDHSFKNVAGREEAELTEALCFASGDYPPEKCVLTERSPILELLRTLVLPFQARYGEPPTEKKKTLIESLNTIVWKGQLGRGTL